MTDNFKINIAFNLLKNQIIKKNQLYCVLFLFLLQWRWTLGLKKIQSDLIFFNMTVSLLLNKHAIDIMILKEFTKFKSRRSFIFLKLFFYFL
jgi:hypothetical protein